MKTNDEIVALYEELRKQRAAFLRVAQTIAKVNDGDIRLPLPEELSKLDAPAVANLVSQGIDAYGQRISSTMPMPLWAPTGTTDLQRRFARERQDLNLYWWDENTLDVRMGTIARHFCGYGSTMMMVKPQRRKRIPEYVILDPVDTFPVGDDIHAEASIHVHRKTRRWVEYRYPGGQRLISRNPKPSDEVELIEYVDDDEWVILGRLVAHDPADLGNYTTGVARLATIPNLAAMCPVLAVGRPGLTRPTSQFAPGLGMFFQRAMLQAYDLMGVRMSVLPKTWVVAREGQTPSVTQMPDPITGQYGVVSGAEVQQLFPQVNQQLPLAIDRLERDERVQAGVVPQMGGEMPTNVRTGRAGDQVLSHTVDLPVQEAQKWIARMLREANKVAVATDKGFWGGTTKSFYVTRQGAEEKIDYDPDRLWTTDRHTVSYAHAGADVNGLIVGLGQSIGLELMSKFTGRKLHPMIEDPEFEHDQGIYERLETLGLNVLEAQGQAGAIKWEDLVGVMRNVRADKMELIDALVAQDRIAQERAAAQAQQPGMGPQPPPDESQVQAPSPSLGHLGQMLRDLRLPTASQAPGLPAPPTMSGV